MVIDAAAVGPAPPSLSVIVIANGPPALLERCLAALLPQQPGEIIVADGSREGAARAAVAACAPPAADGAPPSPVRVRWLHRPGAALEWLRDAAVREAAGDLLLFTEARMQPAADWCARFLAAHQRAPAAGVIGGAIAAASSLDAVGEAIYRCEYASWAPPLGEPSSIPAVSAANVSYRRSVVAPPPAPFAWDAALHHRERWPGLRASDAGVTFAGGYTGAAGLAMRFHYARAFAARRPRSLAHRAALAAISPGLPLLLWLRTWRAARTASLPPPPVGVRLWMLAFVAAWAVGEMVGYVGGAGRVEAVR